MNIKLPGLVSVAAGFLFNSHIKHIKFVVSWPHWGGGGVIPWGTTGATIAKVVMVKYGTMRMKGWRMKNMKTWVTCFHCTSMCHHWTGLCLVVNVWVHAAMAKPWPFCWKPHFDTGNVRFDQLCPRLFEHSSWTTKTWVTNITYHHWESAEDTTGCSGISYTE